VTAGHDVAAHEALGELEVVHLFTGAMPTGVSDVLFRTPIHAGPVRLR
jgi:hypothetical protein